MTTTTGSYLECTYTLMAFGIPREAWPIKVEDGQVDLQMHRQWLQDKARREQQQEERQERPAITEAPNNNKLRKVRNDHNTSRKKKRTSSPCSSDSDTGGFATTSTTATTPTCINDGSKANGNKEANSNKTPAPHREEITVPGSMDIVMGRGRHPSTSTGHMQLLGLVENRHDDYERASKFDKTIIANIVLQQLVGMGCRFLRRTANGYVEEGEEVARDKVSHAFRNRRKKKTPTTTTTTSGGARETTGTNQRVYAES
jgi:hypothetical protein